jgi:para-aminobenzoate synthetase/4-amino-4-deoxychorismate lyase
MDVVALLDDSAATDAAPTSRLYTAFVAEHCCDDPAALESVCAAVAADQARGLHALLLADYEWGTRLLRAGHARWPEEGGALRVLMFASLERLSHAQATAWLEGQADADDPPACGAMNLESSVDREGFVAAIERIHAAIAAGETYQVNYTYRLHGQAYGTPLALYRALRTRQPVHYGAFIVLPPGGPVTHVLSCSPELFLRHADGIVTARPMKGTAARYVAPEGDSETARGLAHDIKNRAENLMIVDLLRNDLGRVAQTGSVHVPALFAIEPYATVFQMTSTVQARLRPEVDLAALLRATFPCGSITGAPKHHTMALIAALESTPRGLYCGAIGWLDAPRPGTCCGDFCLSVAIRTLTLGAARGGLRPLRLGIGAGIVKDSVAADEYEECRLKARFLTGLDPGFELFETMLVMPGGGIRHLGRHLARLAHSAHVLGFAFDADAVRVALRQRCAGLVRGAAYRLRLALRHDGTTTIGAAPLQRLDASEVTLHIAPQRLPEVHPLAAHKTTLRAVYDEGVRAAERAGAFDSLFFDCRGHLVEGGRSSVFVRLDGRWWTPPLADGVLPSVMRGVLLADPAWGAGERRITLAEVEAAEALLVCNALRGGLPARLASRQPVAA